MRSSVHHSPQGAGNAHDVSSHSTWPPPGFLVERPVCTLRHAVQAQRSAPGIFSVFASLKSSRSKATNKCDLPHEISKTVIAIAETRCVKKYSLTAPAQTAERPGCCSALRLSESTKTFRQSACMDGITPDAVTAFLTSTRKDS